MASSPAATHHNATADEQAGTLIAPRRTCPTRQLHGREVYSDTNRPVDERLGSHIVLWIVDDPDAWAAAIEAEGDHELTLWPKRQRPLAEKRRADRYASAAQVRAEGIRRSWFAHYHHATAAQACAADLRRSHPNPGVRYEVVEIISASACSDCHQPTVHADGQWRHHILGFPVECNWGRPDLDPPTDRGAEHKAGEWTIDVGMGAMICGYCTERVSWIHALLGARLTGDHLLGIERATGALVVLAEATTRAGQITYLPHHCAEIPDDIQAEYAHDIEATRIAVAEQKETSTWEI